MKTPRLIFALLWFGMAARGSALSVPGSPEVRLLEEAKTFKVEVDQKYGDDAGIELPFELVVSGLMEAGGLKPATEGDADVTVRIHAKGTPLAQKYEIPGRDTLAEHYSGAHLVGWIELSGEKGPVARLNFSGHVEPPFNLNKPHPEPEDAPFMGAFSDFVDRIVPLIAHGRGYASMEKVLAANGHAQHESVWIHESAESLSLWERDLMVTRVPWVQTAAALALAEMAPPGVLEILVTALHNPPVSRQAAAVQGLLVLQRQQKRIPSKVLPDLISMLSTGEEGVDANDPGPWSSIEPETATQRGKAEDGFPRLRPAVLQLLRALPASPEKQTALLAALEDKNSVMRRIGAALLLGWDKDAKAVKPLIAALENDPDDYVQAAAANALRVIGDKRAAVSLLKRALQTDEGGPAQTSALNALRRIAPEMVPPKPKPEPEMVVEPTEEEPTKKP